jgi:hypothetical protein
MSYAKVSDTCLSFFIIRLAIFRSECVLFCQHRDKKELLDSINIIKQYTVYVKKNDIDKKKEHK